jgi:hypothetical protein
MYNSSIVMTTSSTINVGGGGGGGGHGELQQLLYTGAGIKGKTGA